MEYKYHNPTTHSLSLTYSKTRKLTNNTIHHQTSATTTTMASPFNNTTTMVALFFLFFFKTSVSLTPYSNNFSLSFPLSLTSKTSPSLLLDTSLASKTTQKSLHHLSSPSLSNVRTNFKYSTALIVSLRIGTPPQVQQMVLDTGSQLSWIQCNRREKKKPTAAATTKTPPKVNTSSFDPSLSSSFSVLPCNHPLCKPRTLDFTLPTDCDHNRLCHYSYFYADGTLAEGNLVREKFTFSSSQSTLPMILGCAVDDSSEGKGILGMNLGRLSFASQAKISRFSYCVPTRSSRVKFTPTGWFYLGRNPHSAKFRYVSLLNFSPSQRSPNLDPLAYTVPMQGIRIGGRKLNISTVAFRPDASGSGQTLIDSGSEFTYLVSEAYDKVRHEIVRLVGPRLKRGYVYGGVCDMCFDGNAMEIARLIGDMVLEFDKGVEVVIARERVLADVGGGVHCVGIGRSDLLGLASNIIGNFHQQSLWVEFDLANRRVGFGNADCSRSV